MHRLGFTHPHPVPALSIEPEERGDAGLCISECGEEESSAAARVEGVHLGPIQHLDKVLRRREGRQNVELGQEINLAFHDSIHSGLRK